MNTRIPALTVALLLLSTLNAQLSTALAQGSLAPPGAPAPTMKTLDQIEARTPISSLPYAINAPGSYYLTRNLTGVSGQPGITITASNVSLDLNGFTMQGVGGSGHGIVSTFGLSNLSIRNGVVTGWGGSGVNLLPAIFGDAHGVRIADLTATNNAANGIVGGASGVMTNCIARGNGGTGLHLGNNSGTISGCMSLDNGGDGIVIAEGGTVSSCSSIFNTGDGINLINGESSALDCVVLFNTGNGINAGSGSSVNRCNIVQSGVSGVVMGFSNRITNNEIYRNATGINAGGVRNYVEANCLFENGTGVKLSASGNTVANNQVSASTIANYDLVAGNQLELLLSNLPQSIDWPANVRLAGTLTGISGLNGITVASDNVTIDLGGHALVGVPGSLKGILLSGSRSNLVVRNGTVRSWGGDGIDAVSSVNGQFDRLQLSNNGGRGMNTGDRALVTDCAAKQNGGHGFFGGIIVSISRCQAALNTGFGISVSETAQIEKCNLNNNTGGGISVTNWSVVRDNNCDFHTAAPGISVTGARNRIEGNHLTRNQSGITLTVSSSSNTVVRNSASGSTGGGSAPAPNYSLGGASNDVGPVGTAAAATSPWANLSN